MDRPPVMTLHCVRKDGRRERTKLSLRTLSEAREVARRVLQLGGGLYTEVDICTQDGIVETIQNSAKPVNPSEVLLVEDNPGDALLVGQALADCSTPIHLHVAKDGEQALQMLDAPDYKPDLIILDLNLPKLSGYGVLALYPVKKTPVVVFSASENEADVDRAFTLGAKDFVHKPLDLNDYRTAVFNMVQKWTAPNETTATVF